MRGLLHSRGYWYRLHDKRLPGKPDLVFAGRRKLIFVHGCFWHRHDDCPLARKPKSRTDFWRPKLEANRARDQVNIARLEAMGWCVLVVWECELRNVDALLAKLGHFLDNEQGTK